MISPLTTRRQILALMGTGVISALPLPALAHRQRTTLSKIDWNAADKALYITHSYHMHDAETALAARGIINKPDLTSLRARAQLALYTQEQFKLSMSGTEIELEILGAEFEARTVYVYQQAFLDEKPAELLVSAAMLRDIIPGQINHVDSWLSESVNSIEFKESDGPKKLVI